MPTPVYLELGWGKKQLNINSLNSLFYECNYFTARLILSFAHSQKAQSSSKPSFPSFFIVFPDCFSFFLSTVCYSKPLLKLSAEARLTVFDETCLSYYVAQQTKSNIYESFMQGIRRTPVCGWTWGIIYVFLPSPNSSCSGHWAKRDAGSLREKSTGHHG